MSNTSAENKAHQATVQGSTLIKTLLALLLLTGASWGLAYVPMGHAGYLVALAIAAVKATIVGAIFMELVHVHFTYRFIALLTFSFIALICAGIALDVLYR